LQVLYHQAIYIQNILSCSVELVDIFTLMLLEILFDLIYIFDLIYFYINATRNIIWLDQYIWLDLFDFVVGSRWTCRVSVFTAWLWWNTPRHSRVLRSVCQSSLFPRFAYTCQQWCQGVGRVEQYSCTWVWHDLNVSNIKVLSGIWCGWL